MTAAPQLPGEAALANPAGPFIQVTYDPARGRFRAVPKGTPLENVPVFGGGTGPQPADAFLELQRAAGELLACEHAGSAGPGIVRELRKVDKQLWPVILAALGRCARGSGKLHPMIAAHLVNMIEDGLGDGRGARGRCGALPAGGRCRGCRRSGARCHSR
jgi:hypothetical protein